MNIAKICRLLSYLGIAIVLANAHIDAGHSWEFWVIMGLVVVVDFTSWYNGVYK